MKAHGAFARKHNGQAHSMHGNLWAQWLVHTRKVGPTWLHVISAIMHIFGGLRVTEACKLKGEHVNTKNCERPVYLEFFNHHCALQFR